MNTLWSTYVQTSEELYAYRAERFRDDNRTLWLTALGVRDGMSALEVGCGSGLLCHRVKAHCPGAAVTGLDRDSSHIAFARRKTAELGLDVTFTEGDATALPFADNTFDVCFSHTVFEHVPTKPFLREQYRVLKPGGRIAVLSVRTRMGTADNNAHLTTPEEEALFTKAWSGAGDFDKRNGIATYERPEREYPPALVEAGFTGVGVDFFAVSDYNPDSVDEATAVAQIEAYRMAALTSVQKGLAHKPDALSGDEKKRLTDMIRSRFDRRIAQRRNGEQLWDFTVSVIMAVTGYKPGA